MLKERFIKEGFQFDYIYDWILIPLKLKDFTLSNRIPLNRFTKKEDTALSMNNLEASLNGDFEQNAIQPDEKPKEVKEEQIQNRTKKAMSNL
jgi:hypothetical protein